VEGVRREVSLPAGESSIPEGHLILRLPWAASIIGVLLIAVSFVISQPETGQFYRSYLVAFLFVMSLGLGALVFVLIQFATRAGWSVAVRRVAENTAGTLPLMALLFVPLVPGFAEIFPWFNTSAAEHDELLARKAPYLNSTFLYVRCTIYLVLWAAAGWWFRRQSIRQDSRSDPRPTRSLQTVSPVAIVFYAITVTFASFDWIMSLDPHWYSTVFGV